MSRFDEWARQKLEDHKVERPADAWQRFAEQMPAADTTKDTAFDSFVRKQLNKHQAHYEHRHWQSLRHSLNLQANRLRELTLAKSFEIAVALLLIFPVLSLYSPDTSIPAPILPESEVERPMAFIAPALPGDTEFSQELASVAAIAQAFDQEQSTAPSATDITQKKVISPFPATSLPSQSASAELAQVPIANVEHGNPAPWLADEDWAEVPDRDHAHIEVNLLPVDVTSPQLVISNPGLMAAATVQQKRFHKHRVSVALQADMHHITTPYDAVLDNRGYDQVAMGYGAAMSYGWESRKWGVRAQMSYRHLYYLPKPFTEIFEGDLLRGYFSESIRNIELNLVSLGLYGTRSIGRLGPWHVYGMTGATCHMAILASYDRRQEFHPGSQMPEPVKTPEPTTASLISQKRYPDGLFQNGPFPENTYISLDAGIGLERHFGGRISLFLEPVFHYNPFQRSLGPNNDRINTISALSGVRILL